MFTIMALNVTLVYFDLYYILLYFNLMSSDGLYILQSRTEDTTVAKRRNTKDSR